MRKWKYQDLWDNIKRQNTQEFSKIYEIYQPTYLRKSIKPKQNISIILIQIQYIYSENIYVHFNMYLLSIFRIRIHIFKRQFSDLKYI